MATVWRNQSSEMFCSKALFFLFLTVVPTMADIELYPDSPEYERPQPQMDFLDSEINGLENWWGNATDSIGSAIGQYLPFLGGYFNSENDTEKNTTGVNPWIVSPSLNFSMGISGSGTKPPNGSSILTTVLTRASPKSTLSLAAEQTTEPGITIGFILSTATMPPDETLPTTAETVASTEEISVSTPAAPLALNSTTVAANLVANSSATTSSVSTLTSASSTAFPTTTLISTIFSSTTASTTTTTPSTTPSTMSSTPSTTPSTTPSSTTATTTTITTTASTTTEPTTSTPTSPTTTPTSTVTSTTIPTTTQSTITPSTTTTTVTSTTSFPSTTPITPACVAWASTSIPTTSTQTTTLLTSPTPSTVTTQPTEDTESTTLTPQTTTPRATPPTVTQMPSNFTLIPSQLNSFTTNSPPMSNGNVTAPVQAVSSWLIPSTDWSSAQNLTMFMVSVVNGTPNNVCNVSLGMSGEGMIYQIWGLIPKSGIYWIPQSVNIASNDWYSAGGVVGGNVPIFTVLQQQNC